VARADPPRARLFVALDLPAEARAAIGEWQSRALAGRSDLRAVAPESLHLTLAFLGSRPEEEIDRIAATVEPALEGLRPARLTALAASPVPRRRPRLFALDLDDEDGHAGAAQAAVARALIAHGLREPERRAFWPHVTVARVVRAARSVAPLTLPPPAGRFTADHVTLYRSHLGRGPARYEALSRVELSPRP
jgi:RNA 2',3'-cyclic 3'-phosphodiesterase